MNLLTHEIVIQGRTFYYEEGEMYNGDGDHIGTAPSLAAAEVFIKEAIEDGFIE